MPTALVSRSTASAKCGPGGIGSCGRSTRICPFDQFITWQLAGDLLPNATEEQILATAFNRLHQQESEGGSVEEEYRVEYVCDRVQTFATTFLGLTFECCSLPRPQVRSDHAARVLSVLRHVPKHRRSGPVLLLHSFAPHSDVGSRRRAVESSSGSAANQSVTELQQQGKTAPRSHGAKRSANGSQGQRSDTGCRRTDRSRENWPDFPLTRWRRDNSPTPSKQINRRNCTARINWFLVTTGQAIEFTGDDAVDLPLGNFGRQQPFSVSLWLKTPDVKERAVVVSSLACLDRRRQPRL